MLSAAMALAIMSLLKGGRSRVEMVVCTGGVHAECGDGAGNYVIAGDADVSQRTGLRAGVLLPHLHHLLPQDPLVHRHPHAGKV